jgi:(p)ppGpp synthase/HD superfamily hydrolase
MTRKEAHPSSKWLDYAKTTMAQKHIRAYLEKNSLLAKLKSLGRS